MDKKTILAFVLSGLVCVVYGFIQFKFIAPKQMSQNQTVVEEVKTETIKENIDSAEKTILKKNYATSSIKKEETEYVINTNKAKIVLTNKGGDVISYKIKQFKSNGEEEWIEMADSITDTNRAFSLTFGKEDNLILNDIFNVKKFDDYTIGFFKDYIIKDKDGNDISVVLGKKYTFKEDDYVFKLDINIINENDSVIDFDGVAYSIRTSPQIGPHFNSKNQYDVRQVISSNGSKALQKPIVNKVYKKNFEWAGVAGKYFTILIKPEAPMKMHEYISASNEKVDDYENSQIFLERKADSKIDDSYYIYVGPRSEKELIKYNSQDKNEWNLVNMKFNLALQKNFLSISWIETAIKWMLTTINKFSKNWGVSIIILTILIKLLLFPLNNKSAMGTLKMQEIQPKMQELQTKYANDQQKLSLEMQKLYKEVGYNPMSGCLPMILQMVILFSMYAVFNNHFEFRGASFIPGWIDDLSNPDSVFSWEKKIFLISGFTNNNIRVLPIVYTLSQLLNGKITQFGGSASATNKGQMKFMTYGIPIIFFFLFYNIPSGLLLYWTVSNILQIGQQLIINNVMKKKRMEMEKNKPEVNKNVLKFKGGKKKTR